MKRIDVQNDEVSTKKEQEQEQKQAIEEKVEKLVRFEKKGKTVKKKSFGEHESGKDNDIKEKRTGFLRRFNSIRFKLIAAFLIPIFFIMILGAVSYKNASNALIQSYKESTFNSVSTSRNYFELATNAIELRLTQLKGYDNLKDYYAGAYKGDRVTEMVMFKELKIYVDTTAFADSLISNIGLICKYGETLCSTGKFNSTGAELVEAYLATEEGKTDQEQKGGYTWAGRHKFFDENLVIDSSKPKIPYAFSVSSAFFGNGLKQIGYMFGDISYDLVVEQLKSLEVGSNSLFVAVSADGYEVTSRPIEGVAIADQAFYQEIVAANEVEGSSYVDYQGDKYLFSYAKVGKTGIVICGLVPYSYLTSQATPILISTLILVLIAVGVAILIATIISTGMGRSIKRMITALHQAAQGDLTVSIKSKRNDELRVLSDTSNHMITNMKSLIEKASKVKDTMNASTKEVVSATDTLTIASKNISNSIEEIRQGIVQQAEDSEKCLLKSEELGDLVEQMSDSIVAIDRLTKESKEVVNDGVVSIGVLKEKTTQTARITGTIIADMDSLEEESKSIGKIISVINDIAEQTNLLSLNASIEAARAGDAGRGFAVVAEEIRKLAEQSMKASNEIGNIIRSIQDKTKHTVDTVKVSDNIVKSQSTALDTTITIFEKINNSVESIVFKLKDITSGIGNIKEAENTTIGAIESISAVSEETAAASEEVDNAANRQVVTVEGLRKATVNLTREAEELNKALDIFKI